MFNLYNAGILVGKLNEMDTKILDVFKDQWVTVKDQEQDDIFMKKFHLEPNKLIALWSEFQTRVTAGSDSFTTSNGSVYERNGDLWVQRNVYNPIDIITKDQEVIGFVSVDRMTCTVLVKAGKEADTPLSIYEELPKESFAVEDRGDFLVSMRDGIRLSTKVLTPKGKEKSPVILIRTPYGKENYIQSHLAFVQRGYAVVIQDTRGREASEGEWIPCFYETDDGDDALNWIGESEFCDGNIGMIGASYGGYVQWAAASSGNPYLKAMVSIVTSGSPFVDLPYRGGCMLSGILAWAFAMSGRKIDPDLMQRDDWDELLKVKPISKIVETGLGKDVEFWKLWCENDKNNDFWEGQNWYQKKEQFRDLPTFVLSGWYDDDNMGTTEAIDLINECDFSNYRILLGPWLHKSNSTRDINGVSLGKDAIRYDLDFNYLQWFEEHLKQIPSNRKNGVEYYSMGEQKWKSSDVWPPKGKEKSLYFKTDLNAEGAFTDFVYDPSDPAPHIIDLSTNEASPPGDYQEIEKRADVITFTSDRFDKTVTIAGDLVADFYASSDCADTDWVVRVTDVYPDGRSIKIAENVLRAKFRNGFEKEELLEENRVYNYRIRLSKIANQFQKDHRIRVMITSSASGFIFSNTNTGNNPSLDTTYRVAQQRIYHDEKYRSRIILPIVED
jgi:hypothetical protein